MSLRLGGLISGADTDTLIKAIMELERVRVYRQEERQSQLEAKQKAWRDVRSALTNIQSKLDQLRFPTLFRSRKVELSDDSVAAVTADPGAAQTSYVLKVRQLAQSHMVAGTGMGLDQPLAAGSFQIGHDPSKVVTVTDGDTLSDLAAKINQLDAGVMAHVMKVDEQNYRIVLTATESGIENAISLTQISGATLMDVGLLNGDGTFGNTLSEARNAIIELNGQEYERSTNVFDNILPGIKITVRKPSGDDPVSMFVSSDIDKVVQVVKDWVNAVNSLQDQLKKLSAYDVEKKTSAALVGESLVRSIQHYIRQPFSGKVEGMPDSLSMLSQIGVSSGAYGSADYGKIVVDEQKLREALQQDPEGVARLFGINDDSVTPPHKGVAVQMNDYIKSLLDTDSGAVEMRDKSLAQQIDRIKDTIERIEMQLEQREKVLRLQFTRMEEAMARLQSQGNYFAMMIMGNAQQKS